MLFGGLYTPQCCLVVYIPCIAVWWFIYPALLFGGLYTPVCCLVVYKAGNASGWFTYPALLVMAYTSCAGGEWFGYLASLVVNGSDILHHWW